MSKKYASLVNTPNNFRTSSTHVERPSLQLLNNLPCVVSPLVGILKHLALHIFGPNSVGSSLKSLWMVESRSMCSFQVHQVSVVKVPSGVAGPLSYSHSVVVFSVVYYLEFMLCNNFLLNLSNFAKRSTLGVP